MIVNRILRTVGAWWLFESHTCLIPFLTFTYFFQFSLALMSWQFYGYIQGMIHEGYNSRWHWDTPAAIVCSLAASYISCVMTMCWLFMWMILCNCENNQKIVFRKHLSPWPHNVETALKSTHGLIFEACQWDCWLGKWFYTRVIWTFKKWILRHLMCSIIGSYSL